MDSATPDPNHAAGEPEFPEFTANASSDGLSPQREPGAADSSNGASSWSAPPASPALTPVLSNVPHATRAALPSELAGAAVARPDIDESPIEPRAEKPELIEHDYQPLLARLEAECRRVISAAETEAETARSNAEDEARRIVADAHRERSSLLRAATSKQALLYQEAEAEIQHWLEELEQEREAVLAAAREEADRRLRAMDNEADIRARERISAAESEAARIVADARAEASRRLDAERSRADADPLPRTPDSASTVSGSESPARVEPKPSTGESGAHGSSDTAGEAEAAPRAPSGSTATNGSTVLASRANGFVLPPPPSAAEESKESLSADSLARLLRGEDGTTDADSVLGEPTDGLSSLVPTEPDVPEASSEADEGTQPSASRRGRRRRHRFGRAQS